MLCVLNTTSEECRANKFAWRPSVVATLRIAMLWFSPQIFVSAVSHSF